jgi:hypothetical protein
VISERQHEHCVEFDAIARHDRPFSGPRAEPVHARHGQPGMAAQADRYATSNGVSGVESDREDQPMQTGAPPDRDWLTYGDR